MSKIDNVAERDEFFAEHFPTLQGHVISMMLGRDARNAWPNDAIDAVAMLVEVVADMRKVEMAQRAEIESLKAVSKAKEA